MVALHYFVRELMDMQVIETPIDHASSAINCFFVRKSKVATNDMAIISFKKAIVTKSGSQPEIDSAVKHLL